MSNPRNVLVLYIMPNFPLRASSRDHLYCFHRYSGHRVFYLNLADRQHVPGYLRKISFDLVIFHTLFLSSRWYVSRLVSALPLINELNLRDAYRIAMPQDEYFSTDVLCRFISEVRIDLILSVAQSSLWETIYGEILKKTKIKRILTGYIEPHVVKRFGSDGGGDRQIDIGYRAKDLASWTGKFGHLKGDLARKFLAHPRFCEFSNDVSVNAGDVKLGDLWYRYLRNCRYVLGVEGGTSIIDVYGRYRRRTELIRQLNSDLSHDEVSSIAFPGAEGLFQLRALSPRHLEACVTGTGQILIQGDYNGILHPNRHYIPLNSELDDLDSVFDLLRDESLRRMITRTAYDDIVRSGQYTTRKFVDDLFREVLGVNSEQKSKPDILQIRNLVDESLHNLKLLTTRQTDKILIN